MIFRPKDGDHPAGRYSQLVWADTNQLGRVLIHLNTQICSHMFYL